MNPEGIAAASSRGRGRGRVPEFDSRRELRRPNNDLVREMGRLDPFHCPPSSASSSDVGGGWSSGQNKHEDQLDSSTSSSSDLNITASEFVPKSTLSATAQEFVPRTIARNTSSWAAASASSSMGTQHPRAPAPTDLDPYAVLSAALNTLTYSPGMFDTTVYSLAESLNLCVNDVSTLEKIADTILETCVRESNFRYTGARLCQYLSSLMIHPIDGKSFRDVLLHKCSQEHKRHTEVMTVDPQRVRSFTQFLAELFLQLSVVVGNAQRRFSFIGDTILDLLKSLSTVKEKENLKSIAQTLKLAGGALEFEEKLKEGNDGKTPLMDEVMAKIIEISKDESIAPYMATLMANLPDLRKANWGLGPGCTPALPPVVSDSIVPQETYSYDDSYDSSQNTVDSTDNGLYYSPDGAELTYEEYEFMNAQIDNIESGGMSEEVEAAFEEFLGSQGKNHSG